MYWWHGGWSWGSGLVMMGLSVVFWALVIWAVLSVVRATSGSALRPESDPEQVLAQRYAAGEIDDDEYQLRLDVLRRTQTGRGTPVDRAL